MATIQCGTVKFSNIQAVLFDKDGTLADAQRFLRTLALRRARLIDAQIPGVQEPLLMAFGLDGEQLNPAGLMAVGTRSENEIAAAAYVAETGRDWLEAQVLVRTAFDEADKIFQRKADETPPCHGVVELLQALVTAGVQVGVVSSDTTLNVQDFVDRYQFNPFIQLSLGADKSSAKPQPELVHQACEILGIPPQSALVVGDADVDRAMSQAAGAAGCIGVAWGWDRVIRLEGVDALANQPSDIHVEI